MLHFQVESILSATGEHLTEIDLEDNDLMATAENSRILQVTSALMFSP